MDNTDGEECQPTLDPAKSIKAIDKTTVHRICSGQVVLTLATAVKELVENSIDAGATSVEVRLKDHGTSLLEVCDNGKGVEEENFEGLTLKHHTSKLRDFGDLVGVKTFGFRGEALSSLCALSDLSVVTRHTSQAVGTKLVYDHNGKLVSKTPVSRQFGTTVSLQNLFSTLPVRHKEFQRNIKKEFNKMVQVLYSYCLISTGVRINCTNQSDKGKKTIVVSTTGHPSLKENISSVFGAKQVSSLLEFKQENATTDVLSEYGMPTLHITQDNCLFTIEGFISSCTHGQGRSSTDRQFYFINARPCDPAKVIKLVNEVYHYYNRHQFPFVVLNIRLKEDDVDINVTPDKRQILVNNEKIMLATIKTSMLKLYENIPSTYSMQNTSLNSSLNRSFGSTQASSSPSISSPTASQNSGRISALALKFGRNVTGSPSSEPPGSPFSSSPVSSLKRSFSQNGNIESPSNKQRKLETFFQSKSLPTQSSESESIGDISNSQIFSEENGSELTTITEDVEEIGIDDTSTLSSGYTESTENDGVKKNDSCFTESVSDSQSSVVEPNVSLEKENTEEDGSRHLNGDSTNKIMTENNKCNSGLTTNSSHSENGLSRFSYSSENKVSSIENAKSVLSAFSPSSTKPSLSCRKVHSATNEFLSNLMARKSSVTKTKDTSVTRGIGEKENILPGDDFQSESIFKEENNVDNPSESGQSPTKSPLKKTIVYEEYDPEVFTSNRKSKTISFSLESLKEKIRVSAQKKKDRSLTRRFHAKIAPGDNTLAEDELKKEISKDMFSKMEILGQFNLGFIIAKLGSDLFIVDQHATDEKYNFETLQQTCVLQNQRLIIPQLLELTAVNESILLDNMDIFKKNGFEFKMDEDKCVGRRVSLTSMPFSRGWEFGREDIEELIFMLSDSPGVMCRPSRVRAMFASRACRKSIMIGTALTTSQMQKLVVHMGEIEQPWNCPHGRPTMRHLVNLDMIAKEEN